jgi:hypothetical protein
MWNNIFFHGYDKHGSPRVNVIHQQVVLKVLNIIHPKLKLIYYNK